VPTSRITLEQVSHHRNHQRLRDRLIETDRYRPVQVSVLLDFDRHKLLARHLGHRPEDSLVQPGFANLGGHVFGYHLDCRNHLSSLFLKKIRVHETLVTAAGSSRSTPSRRGHRMTFSFSQVTDVANKAERFLNCESGSVVRYADRHRAIPNLESAIETAPLPHV
jgi:hypothetical protein